MERMTIKAVHTTQEHRDAIAAIGRIMASHSPSDGDLATLEALAIIVERYEQQTFVLEKPTALEAIRFRMDQMDLTQAKLAELSGIPRSRISDLLNGKRSLSLDMIRVLHEKLGIPADILIGKAQEPIAS